MNAVFVPAIRGAVHFHRQDPNAAIAALQPALRYEFSFSTFDAILVRGNAYLAAKRGAEAVAEFQKLLDHRGAFFREPLYAVAYVGSARAHALTGDLAKSRKLYQDFLAFWKDADPDIPLLRQVKEEYAKLDR